MSAPSLRQDCQAPMKWHGSIYHSTDSVIVLLPWIGLGLLAGLSQMMSEASDVFINMLVPFYSSHSWEVEVNWYS